MLGHFTHEGLTYVVSTYIDGVEMHEYMRFQAISEAQAITFMR